MYGIRWYYLLVLISNCVFNFNVFIQGTDVKGFDDSVLFKINWPGRSGSDFFVSDCFRHGYEVNSCKCSFRIKQNKKFEIVLLVAWGILCLSDKFL
jgi:hypothetical protein